MKISENSFESKDGFGFLHKRRFIHDKTIEITGTLIEKLLQTIEISNEYQMGIPIDKLKSIEDLTLGPFQLKSLKSKDFKRLTFTNFLSFINEFSKEEDWGVDLPAFIYLSNKLIKELQLLELNREEIFLANSSDEQLASKKVDIGVFSYYLLILIPLKSANSIYCFELGED